MSARENNIIKQLVRSIKESEKRQTSAYDSEATVRRIEDGIAWVHIPGGVDETPVKLTINAAVGDTVQVRVSGGRAFLVGNASAPPTDDKVATRALTETRAVTKVVQTVQRIAETAAKIAGNTNQYFWHTETGTDTGAHITEIPQEEFLADPANGGGNLLARSNGIAVRDGLEELATFSASEVRVGKDNSTNIEIMPDQMTMSASDGNAALRVRIIKVGIGDSDKTEYGTRISDEHDLSVINISPSVNSSVTDFTGYLSYSANMTRFSWVTKNLAVYLDENDGLRVQMGTTRFLKIGFSGKIEASRAISAGAVESYTPTWESGQNGANWHCVVSAGICSLSYQGQGVAHTANTLLFTLPDGSKPTSTVYAPFVKMTGNAVGVIEINTDGTVKVNQISSTSATGRIYFNCSFPVV